VSATNPEVLIVGGGPAGLAAAAAASGAGAEVLLVDENADLGGSLRYRVQPLAFAETETAVGAAQLREALTANAEAAGAELQTGVIAAGWYPSGKVLLVRDDTARVVVPQVLIVATGSTDLPFPFAGATLPGVFTARAIQILLNSWRVLPGSRFAVVGPPGEANDVAIDIALAGGEVVFQGVAPQNLLKASGVDGVETFSVGEDRYAVDCVIIAMGRQPDAALATMAGAALAFAPQLGGLVPLLSERLEAAPGIFVAGDAAGIGSIGSAIAEGRYAGLAAALALGKADAADVQVAQTEGGEEMRWRESQRRVLQPLYSQPYQ
jgi:thioredoxin reductase